MFKKGFTAAAFVIVVITAVISCSRYLIDNKKEIGTTQTVKTDAASAPEENRLSNIINGGLVAQQGDWLYYSNGGYEPIKKTRISGSEKFTYEYYGGHYVNIVDDWIYYVAVSQAAGNEIIRMKIDGTNKSRLLDVRCSFLYVQDEWMYYTVMGSGNLFKAKTDGTSITKLSDDHCTYVNVVGDTIYYCNVSDNRRIYRIVNDKKSKLTDDSCSYVNVIGDYIYLININDNGKIYRTNLDGKEKTVIIEQECTSLNIAGEWLFYSISTDDNIHKAEVDGTGRETITVNFKTSTPGLSVLADGVYYCSSDDGFKMSRIRFDGTDRVILDNISNQNDSLPNRSKNRNTYEISGSKINQEVLARISSSSKVEIYHNFHNYFEEGYKPAVLTDKTIIELITSFFNYKAEPQAQRMSGMSAREGQKLVFYDADNVQTIIPFSYDSLYKFGYIEYKGNKIYLPYDFFRLIANIESIRPINAGIPTDAAEIFNKYSWTPSFLIAYEKKILPADLLMNSENLQDKLYWSYNIELSKSIGLDFSNLLSKEITAEIYNLIEHLPVMSKPYLNASGVIIRYGGKIAGAYIDSGVSSSKSCSLDRKSFKEIKNMEVYEWLNTKYTDKSDHLYERISEMSHEDLIRTYFKAMVDKDIKTLFATMSTNKCLQSLFTNMQNNKLYNTPQFGINIPGYISEIKIKEIKEDKLRENEKDKVRYVVTADITPTANAVISSGTQVRFILLENDNGVWKIAGDGTGP